MSMSTAAVFKFTSAFTWPSAWAIIVSRGCGVEVRERTIIRSVSNRNRYWVYRFKSYRLLLYRPILRASLQVQHELLTGRIKQQIKGHSRRSPAVRIARVRGRPPHAEARHMIQDTEEGWWGERRETVTWYQPPRDTDTKRRSTCTGKLQPATDDVAPPSPPAGGDNNCLNCQSY